MILAAVIAIFGVSGAAAVLPERPPATISVVREFRPVLDLRGGCNGTGRSVPASMLTVHVDEVLHDAGGVSALSDVFVPYYAADFTIGGTRFCNAGSPPQVGDRVVIRFSAPLIGKYINVRDLRASAAGPR